MASPEENAGDRGDAPPKEPPADVQSGAATQPVEKRPRGRPRKHPLPVIGTMAPTEGTPASPAHPEGVVGTVSVPQEDSAVGTALLLHAAPAAGPAEDGGPLPQKRPRGRPRKHPPVTAPGHPAEPGAPPAASLGGTAILTQPASAVGQAPLATAGQAAVILKRPRGRPRKHPLPDTGGISGGVSVPQTETGQPGLVGQRQVAGLLPVDGQGAGRPRGRRRKAEPSILNPFCPECGTYLRMFRPARGRWRKVCPRCEPERMVVKRDYRDYIDKTGMPCKDRGKCRPERCVKALECEEMARFR